MRKREAGKKQTDFGLVAPRWWPAVAAIPPTTGFLWMWWSFQGGLLGFLLGLVPGVLLISTGLSNLLWAGDPRLFHFMSLGSVLGASLSLPAALVHGPLVSLSLLTLSSGSYLATGYLALGREPVPPEAPEPRLGFRQSYTAAGDELSMCAIVLTTWPLWIGKRASRIGRELDEALEMFDDEAWLTHPTGYHREPPPLENPKVEPLYHRSWNVEHLTFESGYEPWPEEPGRGRWLSYEKNRTAHAWVMRHPGGPRPWLVGLHGIRMGFPGRDLTLYRPEHLHDELGLNLLLPILPIHGPRRVGLVSGDRILSGDVMDTVHAGAQVVWDIRRLLSWLRQPEQAASTVGVIGYSLGGYTAALLAGLEKDVECVISGNPAVAPSGLFWRNALSPNTRYLKTAGVTREKMDTLMRPVSPLSLTPQIPREKRAIFCGVADRVVPPTEATSLWHHWEKPRIQWYQGSHRGFLKTTEGEKFVEETLRATNVLLEKG